MRLTCVQVVLPSFPWPEEGLNTRHTPEFEELAPYLKSFRGLVPLTRAEEHALALRVQQGDLAAKHELIRRNLALVLLVAVKQRRGHVRLADLVQEGNLGLMRAVEKFDPHAGTRFSTYAVWWIRAYVGRYLKQARSAVRPRSGSVAVEDFSLDAAMGDEEGDGSHLERLEDDAPTPEDACLTSLTGRELDGRLARVRSRLGPLAWDIVGRRLRSDDPETLQQIGARWGVSRERVRQVEKTTKQFLRGYLADDLERDAA